METLLLKYGYAIFFFGIALEGEAFLLAGAFLAQRGYFHLSIIIVLAILANCAADQLYYLAARVRGRKWLEDRFGKHPRYARMLELMARHGNWLLLLSRYVIGFRIAIPAACGALGMPPGRFTIINSMAGLLWAVPMALLGFYFGHAADSLLKEARHYELWIPLVFLVAAALIVVVRHLHRQNFFEDLRLSDFHSLVPYAIAFMGLVNLVSAILPRSSKTILALERWLPLEVSQRSRPLMIFAGVALLQVSGTLARRKELAWYVSIVALAVSGLLHISHAFDLHHSLVAGLLLAYLMAFRHRFHARSDPASLRLGLFMVPVLTLIVWLYGYLGLSHRVDQFAWESGVHPMSESFRTGVLILQPTVTATTRHAAHFLESLQIAGWLARLYLLLLFLRPVVLRDRLEAPPGEIERLFRSYGRHSLSPFAIQTDKHHLVLAAGRGLVGYAIRGAVALACGDPLASDEDFEQCAKEYLDHCHKNGWTGCVYEAAEMHLPVYHGLGLRSLKIGEEALINLLEFSLSGNKRANLRAMVNKVAKTGMVVQAYRRRQNPNPAIDEQLEAISQEWLAEKRLQEMSFTLGQFSLEALGSVPVFVASLGDEIQAFCSWLPYRNGEAFVLDLMRKRKGSRPGTMDFLLAHSLLQFKADGVKEASLANAPLANVSEPRGPLDRGVALLFENLNAFYGYKNLFQFKKKFAPIWEGLHLIYPKGAELPRIAYALAAVHSSGGLWQLLFRR
jgi:phosphatidylglycerol lysyltransferase